MSVITVHYTCPCCKKEWKCEEELDAAWYDGLCAECEMAIYGDLDAHDEYTE